MCLRLGLSLFALTLGFTACEKTSEVVCTMEFRILQVEVNNRTLDSFYTVRTSTGETFRLTHYLWSGGNSYPIATDSLASVLRNRTENFQFRGYIGGVRVIDQTYQISADACHVNKVSGPAKIDL